MSSFLQTDLANEVVDLARTGDRGAREHIYRTFERPVRTLARRLIARHAAAEDVAHDVFVDVLTRLHQFDGRGSFAGWVRSITVNRCLMHLRSPWQRGLRWFDPWSDESPGGFPQVAGARNQDLGIDIERALATLPDTARLVVWLHDVEGYTHPQIGTLLGGTASLSKSQLARAHAQLRELLDAPGEKSSTCMPISTSC
jgi:RNA polymerase sigma-70 factor (ECF subfamily)